MAGQLKADFERTFRNGPSIRGAFELPIDTGAVGVLFGPSGSGKTTILRSIAGLERPDTGAISFADEIWFDGPRGTFVTPQARRVGYLPQDYAVFPHLTAAENVAFGVRAPDRGTRMRTAHNLLTRFGLDDIGERRPRQLSGGQLQRVALARTLAANPQLLLLDEPLSALDASLRSELRGELRRTLKSTSLPALIVTHDRAEALALGDWLMVVVAGRIVQSGPVEAVFGAPASRATAEALGVENIYAARRVGMQHGLAMLRIGRAELLAVDAEGAASDDMFACIRAEDVALERSAASASSARNHLRGRIQSVVSEGPLARVVVDCGIPVVSLVTNHARHELQLREGDEIVATIKATAVSLVARS